MIGRLSPSQILVFGFALTILIGAALLTLPFSSASGNHTPFIDALFMATSAVCVTGLIVVNTATHFSIFGQIIILALIQIGGLGFMTLATMMIFLVGRRVSIKEKLIQSEATGAFSFGDMVHFTVYILKITLLVEAMGAILLALRWCKEFGLVNGVFKAVFHSVSAFCNAGFSVFPSNLINYVLDPIVNLTITSLVIIGGIGYIVLKDVYLLKKFRKFSLHTKIVLITSIALLTAGTLVIFLLEKSNYATMGALTFKQKIMASYFHAVTPRTAGFNTVDISSLRYSTMFFVMFLMFIGASPGSTGGGIKTTTFAVLIASIFRTLKGKQEVNIFNRRIPGETMRKAFVIPILAFSWVSLITFILLYTENAQPIRLVFEVISAFSTVGLSAAQGTHLSLSSLFSSFGKLLISLTMFIGRVGPLTIGLAMIYKDQKEAFKYAEEQVTVG
ncbi:MAG: hypothetical protein A2252_07915 [Elusimicrobia bacterium RIFOXYA2_FULL_39_19]|nr:MAG: hypothetical protein A2252_07915 [Elusimicrobia bacterium RIFOXYA2_FULL_39_19]